jgi:peptidylprolyl isomerase
MSPLNKFETIGIFASVAIMAIALAVVRFETDTFASIAEEAGVNQQATIVVANGDDLDAIQQSLADNVDFDGTLKKLIVNDVRKGKGEAVQNGDTITVHYIGRLQDGTQFYNTYLKGDSFTFKVGEGKVIDGWDQGVVGMQVGGERILVVPPHMAYGAEEIGPIPANSPLVFAIELLSIE